MTLSAIAVVFVVLAAVLMWAWRAVRFFIKLALVGLLLVVLLLGLGVWRWQTSAPPTARPPATPARRAH
jgi:hypothetical protein